MHLQWEEERTSLSHAATEAAAAAAAAPAAAVDLEIKILCYSKDVVVQAITWGGRGERGYALNAQ